MHRKTERKKKVRKKYVTVIKHTNTDGNNRNSESCKKKELQGIHWITKIQKERGMMQLSKI